MVGVRKYQIGALIEMISPLHQILVDTGAARQRRDSDLSGDITEVLVT